jgi:PKD repeat protein
LAVLCVAALVVGTGGSGATAQGPPNTPPGLSRGQAAINALGARLPDVAAAYGLSRAQLRALFLEDHTLYVDNNDELLYIDELWLEDQAASQAIQDGPAAAPFPTEDTFTLHSLPGAKHTIYLDFDGHTTVGTTWNSAYGVLEIVSPPYDIDGDPSSFSATEIERIQQAWQIVAEDYAPFNVNVTTQDPGAAALSYSGGGDTQWGTRVVITDDTFANCGCGGHAYIGSFDDYTDEPVFVYNSSLVGVSEASTHEVGHALNLSHDGTSSATYYTGHGSGETGWAPLMGASYYQPVTQWSMGEYYDANNGGPSANYGNGPDDLAVIASLTNGNGFGYRADDHGDSRQAATPMAVNGTAVSGAGVIERTSDVDVFSFSTGAGPVSLSIDGAGPRTNLDVQAELYDASDNLVAVSDPASLVAASLNVTLDAGTYYLHIDGTGTGDPLSSSPTGYTEYGSLGQYTISGTIVDTGSNTPPTASFSSSTSDLTASFTDTSTDVDGTVVSWDWDFGDGNTSTEQDPSHTYAAAGTYTVSLVVTDDDDATGNTSQSVTVTAPNVPPTAAFNYITTDLTADFADASTDGDGTVVSWSWDFGDGGNSTVQNPSHTYAAAGTYTVNLTATDDDGATDSASQSVTVTEPSNVPPTAGFTFSTTYLDASFTDTSTDSDGTVVSWLWNFGDGSTSTDQNPNHGYASAGTYIVSLTVTDDDDDTDSTSHNVTVTDPPAYVDYVATGEILVAGTVSGSYVDTQADGGAAESITERESGGKPDSRYTYLEHKWTFSVPAGGTSTSLYANAWAPASNDGDAFVFSYSTNDADYTSMFTVLATSDDGSYQTFDLSGVSGTVYVKVVDTDHSTGHREENTVYVDHLFIRTDNTPVEPPAAPSGLFATAVSSSGIDLSWSDNSDNELGFHIERSPDGATGWTQVGSAGLDATTFSDTGLNPGTTYHYRVYAYNSGDNSGYSNTASATTSTASYMKVTTLVGSREVVRNKWNATVEILVTQSDGTTAVANATVFGEWSGGATGGAECTTDANGWCFVTKNSIKTQEASVTYTVTDVTHTTYTYDPGSSETSITVWQ